MLCEFESFFPPPGSVRHRNAFSITSIRIQSSGRRFMFGRSFSKKLCTSRFVMSVKKIFSSAFFSRNSRLPLFICKLCFHFGWTITTYRRRKSTKTNSRNISLWFLIMAISCENKSLQHNGRRKKWNRKLLYSFVAIWFLSARNDNEMHNCCSLRIIYISIVYRPRK